MAGLLAVLYGVCAYAFFLVTILYATKPAVTKAATRHRRH
jgi:hypothetical protein